MVLFAIRKSPPRIKIMSRPLIGWFRIVNIGSTNPTTHEIPSRRRILKRSAKNRPIRRADGCSCEGSFPTTIDRNITLSMPRTISISVSVAKLRYVSGNVNSCISSCIVKI